MLKTNDMLTDKEWVMKKNLDLKFNKVFFSTPFKEFIVSKCGYCPSNLTFDTRFDTDNVKKTIWFVLCAKDYGYDSSVHMLVDNYSDFGDYQVKLVENSENYITYFVNYINTNCDELRKELCALEYNYIFI